MIGIKVNKGFLDLGDDFEIQIDLVSPLFSFEIGYGSSSLKFSIPNTPKNRRLLDNADLVTNNATISTYDAQVWLNGSQWRTALLNVIEASKTFQITLDLSESKLAQLLEDKSMQDFSYGGQQTIPGAGTPEDLSEDMIIHANQIASGILSTDYYFFPIRDDNMHEETATTSVPNTYINYYRDNSFWDRYSYQNTYIFTTIQNLIPFPKLKNVLTKALEEIGYQIKDSTFTTDAELQTLCIYNNRTINRTREIFRNYINLAHHVPDVSGRAFFQGLARLFNLGIIEEPATQKVEFVLKRELVTDKREEDWRGKCLDYSLSHDYSLDLSLFSEQDGDDKLISNLQNPEPEESISGEVFLYADLPFAVDGQIYYVGERNSYYQYNGTSWEFFSWRVFPELVGAGTTQKWSNISTTMMTRDTWFNSEIWRVPYVDQFLTGKNPQNNLEKWPFAPRLLFYRGMTAGSPSYPLGSADDVDGAYNYSLYWHGENGLFNKFHKEWTDLMSSALPLTYFLLLNINDLDRLDWTKKVRVRVKEGEARAFIKKLSLVFNKNGVKPVKADLMKI